MSNRNQIDSVIDDDDEFCPLCIEEFDLSDKNFKPCPCGYQICQFCYNNIKTHNEEGRCPNCRRPYDESTIQYKVPDADEFKADLALKHRKAAAAKKKEVEKREIEASSRKNLAGVRVVQKNLVYVIGLNPTIRDEAQLLQTLRGPDYFGQYGEIDKIVVSKAKPGGNPNQGIGVYVTFSRKADAATCIAAVDGSQNGDRILRAQYGTTKYCSSFLRNEQCNNRNCTFLHETGDDSESYSRQDLSSMNTAQRHGYSNGASAATGGRPLNQSQQSQPMRRQGSKDDASKSLPDGPALPSSASWANKDAPINRARRVSLTGSRSSPSPKPANVTILAKNDDSKDSKKQPAGQDSRRSTPAPTQTQQASSQTQSRAQDTPSKDMVLESLLKAVNSPDFRFVFSTEGMSKEDIKYIENGPSFIDPYGGVKRRAMREKAEQERAKQEAEAQSLLPSSAQDEETREGGSLQLGGEPDDVHPSRGTGIRGRDNHGAIQPPSQQTTANNSAIGSPLSLSQQFQNLNLNTRNLTPQQQQQLMLLKSANGQQSSLMDHAIEQVSLNRQGAFQGVMPQGGNASNARILGQQGSLTPNPLATPGSQQNMSNQFYTSSVQGPPPGLKTAGTPPISGGGMFAQGYGFTSNANLGLGANAGKQEASPDLMRELLRGRSGTAGTGGMQGHEAKREYMFPFLQQHNTPPPLTPATGLLSAFYGSQAGTLTDSGPQKQRKKGKKHRHANTSSGGGGVVDLADPSILQARMHPSGVGTTGQVLYGSQGQVNDAEFPPLNANTTEKVDFPFRPFLPRDQPEISTRSQTPTLPPGLPLPLGHPAAAILQNESVPQSPVSSVNMQMHPSGLPFSRHGTPLQKSLDGLSRGQTPVNKTVSNDNLPLDKARNFGDISLGSPKARSSKRASADIEHDKLVTGSPQSTTTDGTKDVKKGKPIKLDLSIPSEEQSTTPTSKDGTKTAAAVSNSNVTAGSRPGTPMTGASRNSDSSGTRQPRVLRVVETPKAETPPPPQVTQPVPSVAQARGLSRQPSLSSSGRPTTPADVGSDYDPTTSASVSRADSPPPTRIGSAPVRAMTKNQLKKERRLKAKQAEEALKEEASGTANEDTVQAPIVGRKRKTKKAPTTSSEQSATATGTTSKNTSNSAEPIAKDKATSKTTSASHNAGQKGGDADKGGKPAPPAPTAEKEPRDEPWRTANTVSQLVKDIESGGGTVRDLFLERSSPLHLLLAQLHKTGQIDLNSHPLFNPPSNHRTDMKCTPDDYDLLQEPIELTEEARKTLEQGLPLRINNGSEALKDRCLITPKGRVLRHLSYEEEERYLLLESRAEPEVLHEYPALTIPEPDYTNFSGGLAALFATPEKFNIRWVTETPAPLSATGTTADGTEDDHVVEKSEDGPPNVLSAMEADATRLHNENEANGAPGLAPHHDVEPNTRPTAGDSEQLLEVRGVAFGEIRDIDNIPALSEDELHSYIQQAQKDLEISRKEFDTVDKKFNALVKRNKKIVQQALTAVLEIGK